MSNRSKLKKPVAPIKLDLGCGENCQPGFVGVDLYAPSAQVKLDLMATDYYLHNRVFLKQWPWKENTVDEIFCSHFIEHIPHTQRWSFFEECYRIMKLDATMRIFVPNWKSERAYGDMTHEWPPVSAFFFYYLNRSWREANKLTYGPYALKCNFEHQAGPTSMSPAFADRNHEVQMFACTHHCESFPDMWVTLTKKS